MPRRHIDPWKDWYSSRRWQKIRVWQLRSDPWCALCRRRGEVTPAEVVDHIEPHGGDPRAFWFGTLQSLCRPCHDGEKRTIELKGYSNRIGADGYPVDPNHPFNANSVIKSDT